MNAQDFLAQKYKQAISHNFKEMLKLAEDMKADHDFHYAKLYENIPEEYHGVLNTANHFTSDKSTWIRKRILDIGNESLRNFSSDMENVTVSFIFK